MAKTVFYVVLTAALLHSVFKVDVQRIGIDLWNGVEAIASGQPAPSGDQILEYFEPSQAPEQWQQTPPSSTN